MRAGTAAGFVEGGDRDEWRGVGHGVGGRGLVECGGHAGQREAACSDPRRGSWLRSDVSQKNTRERPAKKPRRIGRHSLNVRDLHSPSLGVLCAENPTPDRQNPRMDGGVPRLCQRSAGGELHHRFEPLTLTR